MILLVKPLQQVPLNVDKIFFQILNVSIVSSQGTSEYIFCRDKTLVCYHNVYAVKVLSWVEQNLKRKLITVLKGPKEDTVLPRRKGKDGGLSTPRKNIPWYRIHGNMFQPL